MSSLRILGLSYLAAASLASLAIALSDHDALNQVVHRKLAGLSRGFDSRVTAPLMAFARLEDEKLFDPQVTVPLSESGPGEIRTFAHADVPVRNARKVAAAELTPSRNLSVLAIAAPDLPDAPPAMARAGDGAGPPPQGETRLTLTQREAAAYALNQDLTPEMLRHFDLFLFVSKAAKGPLAQRLYVFRKDAKGDLTLVHDWAASTGREQYETSLRGEHTKTDTPAGYYQIDPDRMYRDYKSHAWGEPMPYTMFFNWEKDGYMTGIAIHGAWGPDVAKLGNRASAGCVHVAPEHAKLLFDMIRADYRGKVPRFAYDRKNHTLSNKGEMMRNDDGGLVLTEGYKVLIDIQDVSGTQLALD